jgi:hypothetical protein
MGGRGTWRPRYVKYLLTKEKLTDASGLGAMVEVFDRSSISREFAEFLPKRTSPRSHGSYRLGLIQLSSFLYGHDTLDDLEEFQDDPALEGIMRGETVAPRTMGDFLRDFEPEHLNRLNGYLSRMAYRIRRQMVSVLPDAHKPSAAPHLSIDTTSHEQRGEKMEGVAWNYGGKWCLDSQVIFDELGLSYGMQLRPGNTKSGDDAEALIESAFSPWGRDDEKYLSGDSAYCNQGVIRTCLEEVGVLGRRAGKGGAHRAVASSRGSRLVLMGAVLGREYPVTCRRKAHLGRGQGGDTVR